MKKLYTILIAIFFASESFGQTLSDTPQIHILTPVIIEASELNQDIQRLNPVQGTYIYSGKKNEVIDLTQKNVTLTEKYGRQIFAKIPGVFVYDMDGTGNQLNISTRDLTRIGAGNSTSGRWHYHEFRYVWLPCQPLQHSDGGC